jgi:hypothetical protein
VGEGGVGHHDRSSVGQAASREIQPHVPEYVCQLVGQGVRKRVKA